MGASITPRTRTPGRIDRNENTLPTMLGRQDWAQVERLFRETLGTEAFERASVTLRSPLSDEEKASRLSRTLEAHERKALSYALTRRRSKRERPRNLPLIARNFVWNAIRATEDGHPHRMTDHLGPKTRATEAKRFLGDGRSHHEAAAPSSSNPRVQARPPHLLPLALPARATSVDPEATARRAAEEIEARALDLGDRAGNGMEHYGTGDPDVVTRRLLVAQLLDLPEGLQTNVLDTPWAAKDAEQLARFDRRDELTSLEVAIDEALAVLESVGATQAATRLRNRIESRAPVSFQVLANAVWNAKGGRGAKDKPLTDLHFALILADRMERNAIQNHAEAKIRAVQLKSGAHAFFAVDPQRFSTAVLNLIETPELRARTLVDMLLQFREPICKGVSYTKDTGGGAAAQSALELRRLAASEEAARGSKTREREYALARAVTLANPISSSNAILEARHLIGKLRRMTWQLVYGEGAKQPGFWASPYSAIHHNFSIETPKLIAAFTRDTLFSGGDPNIFVALVDALKAYSVGEPYRGRRLLEKAFAASPAIAAEYTTFAGEHERSGLSSHAMLEAFLVSRVRGPLDSTTINDPSLSHEERRHLEMGDVSTVEGEYTTKLALAARLYAAINDVLPSERSLSEHLFSALGAWREVAVIIEHLREESPPLAMLEPITRARQAIRAEFDRHPEGHRRIGLWRVDRQLESLLATHLGQLVDAAGDLKTDEARALAFFGVRAALENAAISGLDQIRDFDDPMSDRGPTVTAVAGAIEALARKGTIELGAYRDAMAEALEATIRTIENMRALFDSRIPEVSEGKLIPNPAFLDDFVKESPLHYARALAEKALRVGLQTTMTPTQIVNPVGVTVLNPLGRIVFDRLLIASTMADLVELGAGKRDMCWVRKMDEKKMLAVGGIMSDFPGGYCHAAVYARGAGIAALSSHELGERWLAFAENLGNDRLYYDDTGGKLLMMPLSKAVEQGMVREEEVAKLSPGGNRNIRYLDWKEAERRYALASEHKIELGPERPTDIVELYSTPTPIHGAGKEVMSFNDIAALGTQARALVGEKSLVLAMMRNEPRLAALIPPGSAIPTLRVQNLLDGAGLLTPWTDIFSRDPDVGTLTEENFLDSRFYRDSDYRRSVRETMSQSVRTGLERHLLTPTGAPTEAGARLLAELRRNEALAAAPRWIVRSSFTAEDRPGKSGAGQYDSFPNLTTDEEILRGVIGVITSAWAAPPVENNVQEEYDLSRIWPAITVMACLEPEKSGVMISRDTGTGRRRSVSYQVVKGFGGGVEDGETEQGTIRENGENEISNLMPHETTSILDAAKTRELWETALEIERLFHRKIEPGRGSAVDIEWAIERDQLKIVQARTIRI